MIYRARSNTRIKKLLIQSGHVVFFTYGRKLVDVAFDSSRLRVEEVTDHPVHVSVITLTIDAHGGTD